ncbi:Hypothetical protein LBF_2154 [Leptospira biflexa serovar Patoc strain 'Patoc 1 (Ames)']|uniref:Uncharacterized protein n=1 Tax=Leptospira biflexa serovar Patoc (strain Patoc 1 / ATCC 23582 / Paris) TaxID=456481 RepID=B0ST74_LEPBP|nr:hypothetical protein [Leptospira biflexa]ABZ94651.1 Hypothetical protein LBF_2154 [Leptospira biflexa serovar Patoc strain 'Patoc 1 (Ames)']ABZ98314.1 Hypothetical protein LEPBI_I2216 [Leptospira biflexa serovar Patoc strain 'Patoc 1 (Paris)']
MKSKILTNILKFSFILIHLFCVSKQIQRIDENTNILNTSNQPLLRYYVLRELKKESENPIDNPKEKEIINSKISKIDFSELSHIETKYKTSFPDLLLFDVNTSNTIHTEYKDYGRGMGHKVPVKHTRLGGRINLSIYNKGDKYIEAIEFRINIQYTEGPFNDIKRTSLTLSLSTFIPPDSARYITSDTYSDLPETIINIEALPIRILYSPNN